VQVWSFLNYIIDYRWNGLGFQGEYEKNRKGLLRRIRKDCNHIELTLAYLQIYKQNNALIEMSLKKLGNFTS
jgi:hypothetical protein